MRSFPETQAELSEALAGGLPPRDLTAADRDEIARRFAVYQNNVMASLREALGRRFPVIARLVGEEFAAALFAAFARAHPPHSPLLFEYGTSMPGFLESFSPVRALPYLADVARLELARGQAYHAADAEPVPRSEIATAAARDPADLIFRLHPSVQVLASAHPVYSIWAINQPGAQRRPIASPKPENVLVARVDDEVVTERIDSGDAAFVNAILDGADYAQAAAAGEEHDTGFDPAPALARLIVANLIVGVGTGNGRTSQ